MNIALGDNSLKDKREEALTKGTLLYELVHDILKYKQNINSYDIAVDLGGRDGSNLALIETFGVDISKGFVIDVHPIQLYKKYEYIRADISKDKLPSSDSSVNLILLIEVIEHLLNPDFLLLEIKRILSEDGIVIIATPNLAWWPNIILLASGHQPIFTEVSTRKIYGRKGKEVVGHLRVFTYLSLREMLLDYGFKILKYKTVQTKIVPMWLKPIDFLVSKIIPRLGCNIYAVVRK